MNLTSPLAQPSSSSVSAVARPRARQGAFDFPRLAPGQDGEDVGAHTFERVEAKCSVVLKGFRKEGEAPTTAKLRIITEAEQRINRRGDIRAHFS